jgi:hypothetical protein
VELIGAVRNISDALGTQQMCLVIILSYSFYKDLKTFFWCSKYYWFCCVGSANKKKVFKKLNCSQLPDINRSVSVLC